MAAAVGARLLSEVEECSLEEVCFVFLSVDYRVLLAWVFRGGGCWWAEW